MINYQMEYSIRLVELEWGQIQSTETGNLPSMVACKTFHIISISDTTAKVQNQSHYLSLCKSLQRLPYKLAKSIPSSLKFGLHALATDFISLLLKTIQWVSYHSYLKSHLRRLTFAAPSMSISQSLFSSNAGLLIPRTHPPISLWNLCIYYSYVSKVFSLVPFFSLKC